MLRLFLTLAIAAQVLSGSTQFIQPPDLLAPLLVQQDTAATVAQLLKSYVAFCKANAKPQYYVDCLSERFAKASSGIWGYGRYSDLKWALDKAARDLYAVTTKYGTPNGPTVTLRSATLAGTRPIRPIAPQNRTRANAAATAVIEETQLVLLRSADHRPDLALAFREVAEVVGTAKVLLRSA